MTIEKWRVTSTETIHKDRWINVRADSCVTDKGEIVAPYYVLAYPDWVHIVALTTNDQLVLIHQYRHAIGEVCLELPGGAVDPHDGSDEHAARRELLEETGYTAERFQHVISLSPNPATHTNMTHTYLALDAKLTDVPHTDAGEDISVELRPVSHVIKGMHTGLFPQSMHVTSTLLALAAAKRISF